MVFISFFHVSSTSLSIILSLFNSPTIIYTQTYLFIYLFYNAYNMNDSSEVQIIFRKTIIQTLTRREVRRGERDREVGRILHVIERKEQKRTVISLCVRTSYRVSHLIWAQARDSFSHSGETMHILPHKQSVNKH